MKVIFFLSGMWPAFLHPLPSLTCSFPVMPASSAFPLGRSILHFLASEVVLLGRQQDKSNENSEGLNSVFRSEEAETFVLGREGMTGLVWEQRKI